MAGELERVQELERADRLEEAAALADELGAHERAAKLFERACRFAPAALSALQAGERVKAFELAARSDDDDPWLEFGIRPAGQASALASLEDSRFLSPKTARKSPWARSSI